MMAGSQHKPDTAQIETRLLVVAEMLEKAVAEVQKAMADIRSSTAEPPSGVGPPNETPPQPAPEPHQNS